MLSTKYFLKIHVNQIRFASFKVPKSYVPSKLNRHIPFKLALSIWYQSLKPGRLQTLQDELTELMLPTELNSHLVKENKKVKIDNDQVDRRDK